MMEHSKLPHRKNMDATGKDIKQHLNGSNNQLTEESEQLKKLDKKELKMEKEPEENIPNVPEELNIKKKFSLKLENKWDEEKGLISASKSSGNTKNTTKKTEHVAVFEDTEHKHRKSHEERLPELITKNLLQCYVPLEELSEKLQKELQTLINQKPNILSKTAFSLLCKQTENSLNDLLSEELTDHFAVFSYLFNKFCETYISAMKIQNKFFEFESKTKPLEEEIEKLKNELSQTANEEANLKQQYCAVRDDFVELQEKFLRGKSEENKEEEVECDEYSKMRRLEMSTENRTLSEKILQLEGELSDSKVKNEMMWSKFQQAVAEQGSLREEIALLKNQMSEQKIMRSELERTGMKKTMQIKRQLAALGRIKLLHKKTILELTRLKKKYHTTYMELRNCKKLLMESQHDASITKKRLAAKSFQYSVLNARNVNLQTMFDKKKEDAHNFELEMQKLSRERSHLLRKISRLQEEYKCFEEEHHQCDEKAEAQKKEFEKLLQQNEKLTKGINDVWVRIRKLKTELFLAGQTRKRLVMSLKEKEQDYIALTKEVEYQKTYIRPLEAEIEHVKFQRDNSVREVLEHKQIIAKLEGTIQALEMQIIELGKKNSKLQSKIESTEEKCKKLSESERDAWAQCRDVKHNLENAVCLQEIAVHRSKIQSQHIRSAHEECDQMKKEADSVKHEMRAVKSSLKLLEDRNKELEKEIQAKEGERLEALKFKSEKEQAVDVFNTRLQSLQNDIKVLKVQMLEKGAAVASKEERINFQQKDIARLQHEIDQKVDEVKLLQTKLASSKRSQTIAENRVGDIEKLRQELYRLNQLLTQEKLQNKSADEELKNPKNLHRWRILQADDPTKAHLINRNLKFQKELTRKTDLLQMREKELERKTILVEQLQNDLKRQADCNSGRKAWLNQKHIQSQNERIKSLEMEVSVLENISLKQGKENDLLRNQLRKAEFQLKTTEKNT